MAREGSGRARGMFRIHGKRGGKEPAELPLGMSLSLPVPWEGERLQAKSRECRPTGKLPLHRKTWREGWEEGGSPVFPGVAPAHSLIHGIERRNSRRKTPELWDQSRHRLQVLLPGLLLPIPLQVNRELLGGLEGGIRGSGMGKKWEKGAGPALFPIIPTKTSAFGLGITVWKCRERGSGNCRMGITTEARDKTNPG